MLPNISKQDIEVASAQRGELIQLLVSRYREIIQADSTGQVQNSFTTDQHLLMAYEILDTQVSSGGFLQLIENGYGGYIFGSPFSAYIRGWGLNKVSDLVDKAKVLYEPHKEVLEREKTLQEFAKLYAAHPEFDVLDQEFTEVIEEQRELLQTYILSHLELFCTVA